MYSLSNVLQDSTWSEKVQGNLSQVTQTVNDRADALKVTKEELEKELEAKRAKLEEDEEAMLAQIEEKRNQLQAKVEELEAEKKAMKDVHTFQSGRLKLDVGGHKFTTSRTTLTSQPDSMLAAMFSGRHKLIQDGKGAYFIDRDGTHFRFILNYLRDGQLGSLPEDKFQLQELLRESDYYQLTELTQHIRVKFMPVVTQATIDSLKLWYHHYTGGYDVYGSRTIVLQVDGRDASTTVTPKFTIRNSSMDKKNLANISFTGIYFSNGFSFKGSYLRGADFSRCCFGSAVYFNDADLTDANFEGCGGLLSGKSLGQNLMVQGSNKVSYGNWPCQRRNLRWPVSACASLFCSFNWLLGRLLWIQTSLCSQLVARLHTCVRTAAKFNTY